MTTNTARTALANLIRAKDLPFAAMSREDRQTLVRNGYAIEDLRFVGYVSIAPRYQGGFDVAHAVLD